MSDTNPISTNQWLHYYQETADGMTGFTTTNNASSLENSSTTTSTISPSGGNSSTSPPLKPIRRRSRASKRTPVTLLNASATNFRALVQQFTGCPQATAAATPFGRQNGRAVNLSFERNELIAETSSTRYDYYNQQQIITPTLPQQTQGTFLLGSSISDPISRTNVQSDLDNFVIDNVSLQNEFIHENGTNSNGGYFF